MLPLVRDKVFPHFRSTVPNGTAFAEFMKGRTADDPEAPPSS